MPITQTDHPSTPQLQGKRILITGASSGVGLAAVRLFAAEGARLVLVARRDEDLRETVRSEGIDAVVLKADLGERDAAQQAVRDAVEALGGLDVVVSNAAAAVFGHVSEVHPDDFDRTVHVTFTSAVDVIREALPHLRESRGTIVATGSLMTRVPLPTWSSYTAAKHALRGFLNTLRIEEREQGSGVRVAMVHPGPIDTPLFAQASSATGNKPRIPPDAYKPEVIARALVAMAIRPRPEVVLGGETKIIDVLFGSPARPVAEAVLLVIDRWYRSGDETAIQPGSLWQTSGRPTALSGGIPSRDSLLAPLQLGRRLLPAPVTPARFVSNLAKAGRKAAGLAGALRSPVPEVAAPDEGLQGEDSVPQADPETVHV
jgi:NAD(P)-dependent dehydrogenase (short-subunit alcohol dehydrogenase family)